MTRTTLPIALVFLAAGSPRALADFDGPYQLQHWSSSGIAEGTTSITPDSGSAQIADFGYSVRLNPAPSGVSDRYATFWATADEDGFVTFDFDWSGMHSWHQARGRLSVFADHPDGRREIVLREGSSFGFFTHTGQGVGIEITQGYEFGVIVGGSNFDGTGTLEGGVEISGFSAHSADDLQPIRFGIDSDEGYRRYLDALFIGETVRQDYLMDRRPEVFGAIAGLAAFAQLNPHATGEQLDAFAGAWRGALADAIGDELGSGDGAALFTALRHLAKVESDGVLSGANTDVGALAMELLGITFVQTDATMTDREHRLWQLERAKTLDLTWAPEPAELLARTIYGVVGDDRAHPGLADSARGLLAGMGYGAPANGDGAYPEISALIGSMPQTLLGYHAAAASGFGGVRSTLDASIDRLRSEQDATMAQIAQRLEAGGGLVDAWANGFDQGTIDAEIERRRQVLERLARERATLGLGTLIMELSPNFEDRRVARQYRDFSGVSLQVNQTAEDVNFGLSLAGGILDVIGGAAKRDPIAAIGGLLDIGGAIYNQFGDDTPSPEEQIFDEIIELRQQVEDMREEMHDRFDRIDAKLNAVFLVLSDGLSQINETTQQIDANVRGLQRQLADVTSELRSIENRLTGLLQEDRLRDLVAALDEALGFRLRNTVDMPFLGADSYGEFENTFYTWSTFEASSDAFAPKLGSVSEADTLIGGALHEQVNILARMRDELIGRTPGIYGYANPVIFAQGADAYAQLASENPWYFARTPGRAGVVIAEGEAARDFMRSLGSDNNPSTDAIGRAEQMYLDARQTLFAELYDPANPGARLWATLADMTPYDTADEWLLQDGSGERFDLWSFVHDPQQPLALPTPMEAVFASPIGTLRMMFTDLTTDLWGADLVDAWRLGMVVEPIWDVELLDDIDTDGGADDFTVRVRLGHPASGRHDEWVVDMNIRYYDANSQGYEWFTDRSGCYDAVEGLLTGESASLAAGWLLDPNGTPGTIEYEHNGQMHRAQRTSSPQGISAGEPLAGAIADRRDEILAEIGSRFADSVVTPAPGFDEAMEDMDDAAALLNGYLSLALPESVDSNQVIRAALRGNVSGSLTIRAEAVRGSLLASTPPSPEAFLNRFDGPRFEWVMARAKGGDEQHAYLAWSLASLERVVRDKLALATDDTYLAQGLLGVDHLSGVLANDAQQTTVDTTAMLLAGPTDGVLELAADGSFTFAPDPGFEGETSFTYVARWVWGDAGQGQVVTSEPATVVIRVTPASCPADLTGDGSVNFFDVSAFLQAFGAGEPVADFTGDGVYNFFDVSAFLQAFGAGCP